MNNKYKTGKYVVELFDTHGGRLDKLTADTYTNAMKLGKEAICKPPYASFKFYRNLYNSLDNFWPWRDNNEN